MGLSNDLISQFVKVTNDEKDTKKETTVYGTIVESNGNLYVQLDGAEHNGKPVLTPVATTAKYESGNRVTVLIKNHSAIVTGNVSYPSARITDIDGVSDKITEFEIAIGNKVDTLELVAINARINSLTADNINVKDRLTANEAIISDIEADNVNIKDRLTANEADISNIEADNVVIHNKLTAFEGMIEDLEVGDLYAIYARVGTLEADVADIDTLMFGSATGNTIQTSFSNAVIAQLGDAQIKSAMIENISASKITSGDIITNNVRVKSEDGSLLISDETMQISDDTRVRVQIGKDASGDYSINIWDQNGNLMFSKGGITDSAIKDAIIRNDMVSDTANIAAHKLDINSLFEEINGSTNTIKSTQVYLDDEKQTLDLAFKEMSDTVTEQGSKLTSQGTKITTIQGQIASKVWQQDIDTATDEMSTQYSSLEQNLDNFKTTVANTYTTKTAMDNLEIGGRNLVLDSNVVMTTSNSMAKYNLTEYGKEKLVNDRIATISFDAYAVLATSLDCYIRNNSGSVSSMPVHSIGTEKKRYTCAVLITGTDPQTVTFRCNTSVPGYVKTTTYISNVKVELGNKATDWTLAPEDIDDRISTAETSIEENAEAITLRATKSEVTELSNNLANNYYTSTQTEAKIKVASDSVKSTVSSTYATKSALSSVEQTATDLTARFDNQKIGGRNLVPNSEQEVSFTNTVRSFDLTEYGVSILKNTQATLSFDLYTDEPGAGCDFYLRYIDSDGSGKAVGITPINGVTDSYVRYSAVITTGDTAPTMFGIRSSQYTTGKTQSNTATFYIRKIKVEVGNMATDWTPAPEDIDGDISDSSKTATNYINASSSGLIVGNHTSSTLGNNVLIDSDSVDIRKGSTVLASFGANTVTLGQNAEDSVINLCDGAGTIRTVISELDNSYPRYDSLALESQQLLLRGKVIDMETEYTNGTYLKESSMTLLTGNSGIGSDYTVVASGDKNQVGVSGAATDNHVSSHYDLYAEHYDASAKTWLSNRVSVYPLRTQFSQPISINGHIITGENKVLWTGGYYMTAAHSCTLSEGVNDQSNGIVLIFSEFRDGASVNNTWHSFFVPKRMVVLHSGAGHCFQMSTSNLAYYATKYLYISNTKITGHDNNTLTGTSDSGITKACNRFVLRYVIGV